MTDFQKGTLFGLFLAAMIVMVIAIGVAVECERNLIRYEKVCKGEAK